MSKSSPTKANSTSQLLFLIVIFCHHLTKVDVAVNFFNLPSIDVDVCFINCRTAHDFSHPPRCILRPTGLLVSWMSCTIFFSSEVDLAISTMSSARMRWDRYSPLILISLSFQLILPVIASCRHDMKSLGEVLSPCLTPLCGLNFLLSVCRWITDVASWYRCRAPWSTDSQHTVQESIVTDSGHGSPEMVKPKMRLTTSSQTSMVFSVICQSSTA